MTPSDFADLLREQGFQGKLSSAGGRIAQILSGAQGVEYTITFYPHIQGGSSLEEFSSFAFLFRAAMSDADSIEQLNRLNSGSRFLRYSLTEDIISVEMDVAITSESLDEELAMRQVNIWIIGLSQFIRLHSE